MEILYSGVGLLCKVVKFNIVYILFLIHGKVKNVVSFKNQKFKSLFNKLVCALFERGVLLEG